MDEQSGVERIPLSGMGVIGNVVLGRPVQLLYMIHSKRDKCIKICWETLFIFIEFYLLALVIVGTLCIMWRIV